MMHASFPAHADVAERNSFLCKCSVVFQVVHCELLLSKIVCDNHHKRIEREVILNSISQRDGSSTVALQDLNPYSQVMLPLSSGE